VNGIDAILVDMDGTLVETGAANYAAYAAALRECGVHISQADFDKVGLGRNWRQFLPEILANAGSDADPAVIARRKAEIYPSLLSMTVLNDGLVRLLAAVRTSFRTALVTTASARNVDAILAQHDLRRLFDEIITGDDVARHKPEPDAYHVAAERLGADPARCLVVEDSDIGVLSGRAFGAAVLRVRMGDA
jgi:HAD superfamily hydrolase (TIGR01509 family)